MVKIYRDQDIDTQILMDKTIAVIGYGIQGRAQALNIRDSGFNLILGLREGGASWKKAKKEGFEVHIIDDATKIGDVIHILIPDEEQPRVYSARIKDYLKKGKAISFSHGFNIHFRRIIPPDYVDVVMIAPKGPGEAVRESYLKGTGLPGLFAVHQDYTGKGRELTLALSKAVGFSRAGVIETTFKEEVETDLFGEQVVLCGGVSELIKAGFETLVEAGYQPELAYYECLYELKLIVDLIWNKGIEGMWNSVSSTAEYGGRTRGKMLINEQVKKAMRDILGDIQTGRYAGEWIAEFDSNYGVLDRLRQREKDHLIEKVGKKIRELTSEKKSTDK
ncbi:MAG: ketol-acid reductoisomerase [Promethearchaeota archaeon]